MVAQSDYEWGTLGGTFWMTFFEVLLWREHYGNNMYICHIPEIGTIHGLWYQSFLADE
jgi:hypothetical protein